MSSPGEYLLDQMAVQAMGREKAPDRHGDYIQTFSGKKFYPFDPRPEDICIEDIAHSLARVSRFTGHTKGNYPMSVAQHSVIVSYACDPDDALAGLLHDASDMAFGDIARPLKYMPEYAVIRAAETRCQSLIFARFGLGPDKPASVHRADNSALASEARDLMTPDADIWSKWLDAHTPLPETVTPWAAEIAERAFLARFYSLTSTSV